MAGNLTETVRELHEAERALAAFKDEAAQKTAELKRRRDELQTLINQVRVGLDNEKIDLAKNVLRIGGSYAHGGKDRASVIRDAMKQLATGEPVRPFYGDLWCVYFGTKNYDRWCGQRSDHDYGYGPKHGGICFSVGLREEILNREVKQLTHEETEAALYYLAHIEAIENAQAIKGAS